MLPLASRNASPPPLHPGIPLQAMASPEASPRSATPDSEAGDDTRLIGSITSGQFADALQAAFGVDPTVEVPLRPEQIDGIGEMMGQFNDTIGAALTEVEQSMRQPPPLPLFPTQAEILAEHEHQIALQTVRKLQDVVNCHIDGRTPQTHNCEHAHALHLDLQQRLAEAELQTGGPLTPMARYEVVTSTLLEIARSIVNNDSDHRGLRITSNFLHSLVKTGLLVVLPLTVIRQYFGMFTEHMLQTGCAGPTARTLIGLAWMMLGPCLTAANMVADHRSGRGTAMSQGARLMMIATAIATIAGMFATNTMSAHASFGGQAAIYCLGRDFLQLFFNVHDNAELTLGSVAVGAAGWSAMQGGTSLANDYLAPNSGAGYVMGLNQTFAHCTDGIAAALNATSPTAASTVADALGAAGQTLSGIAEATLLHTLLRGAFNAIPEVADDLMRQYAERRGADDPLRVNARFHLPTRETIADVAGTTFAGRLTIFENLVGQVLALDTALGKYLPASGIGRTGTIAALTALASVWAYFPLLMSHDRRPRNASDRPEVPGVTDPRPRAELTAVRRRTEDSVV